MFIIAAAIALVWLLTGCAVDYHTAGGSKFRFSLTATPEEVSDALEGWRK